MNYDILSPNFIESTNHFDLSFFMETHLIVMKNKFFKLSQFIEGKL